MVGCTWTYPNVKLRAWKIDIPLSRQNDALANSMFKQLSIYSKPRKVWKIKYDWYSQTVNSLKARTRSLLASGCFVRVCIWLWSSFCLYLRASISNLPPSQRNKSYQPVTTLNKIMTSHSVVAIPHMNTPTLLKHAPISCTYLIGILLVNTALSGAGNDNALIW